MKDTIVQKTRDARAAVAADFDFDLHKFFTWAKTHTAAERRAKHWLPTGPKAVPTPATKSRARPARSSG